MVFFDFAGLAMGAISLALVFGADALLGPAATAAPLVAVWVTLVCIAGLLYDRISPRDGLRAYYLWVSGTFSSVGPTSASRVAVLGLPLVVWPAAACVFGLAFPLMNGEPLPPPWFFAVGLVTPVALLVQHLRARRAPA